MFKVLARTYTFKENEPRTICHKVTTSNAFISFHNSNIISVEIPDGITEIETNAFYNCENLTRVNSDNVGECVIPDGVTVIGDISFMYCTGLTSIKIPSSVTSIGREAFNHCTNLTGITIEATTPPTLGTDALKNTNNCLIYVPNDSVAAYQAASGWSTFSSRIRAIPNE